MTRALTERQSQVFDFVVDYVATNGFPPSRQEISQHFKFRSNNAAQEHLSKIEKKGWIQLTKGINRGIKIL